MNQAQERLIVLKRRRQVTKRYLEGCTQRQIADELEVPHGTISSDLSAIRKEWLSEILTDFNEMKARELAKIDNLELEAWEAWRKSCEPVTTQRKRTESVRERQYKGKGRTKGAHVMTPVRFQEEVTVKEGGTGDPRFMETVSWCIETRLRIANLLKGDTNVTEVTINWHELVGSGGDNGMVGVTEEQKHLILENDPIERQIAEASNLSKITQEAKASLNGEHVTNGTGSEPSRNGNFPLREEEEGE